MPLALLVVSAAATVYGAVEANKAAKNAAAVDTASANYNAKYDEAKAVQLDLDTQANIRNERKSDAVYLSREAASDAASGVLSNTGSALDAQILNAGRMEQQIQQQWVNSNQQQQAIRSKAKVGILAGVAQASADRMRGTLALVDGGAKLAGSAYRGYESGVFSGNNSGESEFFGGD